MKEAMKQIIAEIDALPEGLEGYFSDAFADNLAKVREALAQPEQEPVQYKCTVIDNQHPNGIPLEQWVKPPQRTLVGLTDEEFATCIYMSCSIEAKLKEKT